MNNKVVYILTTAVLFISLGCAFYFRSQTVQLNKQFDVTQKNVSVAKKRYNNKKELVRTRYFVYASNHGIGKVKIIGTQSAQLELLNQVSKDFFKIYYTYSNAKTYDLRKKQLENVASKEILENQKLFSGESKVIENLGVESSYISSECYLSEDSDRLIKGVASVKYNFGYSNTDKREGTQLYEVTYDKQSNKFSEINRLN